MCLHRFRKQSNNKNPHFFTPSPLLPMLYLDMCFWEQKLEGARGLCIMEGSDLQLSGQQFGREKRTAMSEKEWSHGDRRRLHVISCNDYPWLWNQFSILQNHVILVRNPDELHWAMTTTSRWLLSSNQPRLVVLLGKQDSIVSYVNNIRIQLGI